MIASSSPSNVAAYAPDPNGTYGSPVSNVNHDAHTGHTAPARPVTPLREEPVVPRASFMTPESSPVLPRKVMPPMTPVAGPSSIPHTPVRPAIEHADTSRAGSMADHATSKMAVDTAVLPLAPAPIITTPVSTHSRAMTPASRLSSPFNGRLSAADRRATKSSSKSPLPLHPPIPDIIGAAPTFPHSPPPLATPVPQRALGGEIQRIHLQLAADRAERLYEMEARRPEYLVREKRSHPDADIPTLDELDAADATLGVTDSPVKGRRLQLFQATSEETFEQSLLAGGYPGYGQSPAYKNGEPQTPLPNGTARNALSQRALHWLQQATPGQPGPSSTPIAEEEPAAEEPEWVPSEKEIRKRRRLDAFKDGPAKKAPSTTLYPVEVEGRGRLLLNVPPEGTTVNPDTPVKRRVIRRKRRRGGRRGQAGDPQEDEVVQPNWPDSAFPWCLRSQERTHTEKMEEEERLKWIERFLDRESESDSGEDQELRPPLQSHDNDQIAHRRGRGKMVPLRAIPDAAGHKGINENVLVPSDPADARAALLSKRSVRMLASRRKEGADDEVDEVNCIGCDRGDDGNELVQCDECQTWYHLPCIGISDVADLGREEDPWYCNKCLDITPSSPLTEPTFVPTDDPLVEPIGRRDLLFLPDPLLESPAPHWDTELRAPQTPVRGAGSVHSGDGGGGYTRTFSTRGSSRGGPTTPESSARTVRVYNTPGPFALAFDRDGFDPETPFDPTTTPSRGYGLWAARGGHTPTPAKFAGTMLGMGAGAGVGTGASRDIGRGLGGGGGGREGWDAKHGWDDSGGPFSSPYARSIYSAPYDDTPVTRAPRARERLGALTTGGRRLWDGAAGVARPASPGTPPRAGRRPFKMERDGDVMMETDD
ncbi:hypothetical protein C8Q80DRAFT_1265518 [Daedaleopsis nitida]|nr:hypothetical protein C8Q80DRAFT_1265518 [Daedaleopsis nitida]